ncbi:MAG: hypothetical protein ACYTF6_11430, partial [Planctomycetota bacterium]
SFTFALPDVRVGTACKLIVRSAEAVMSANVMLLPRTTLSRSAEQLKEFEIGVIDQGQGVSKALKDEGIAFTQLQGDLAKDYFSGGLVILAGFERAERLAWECEKLTSRVEDGMAVLVINPPPGWSAWGIKCSEMPKPNLSAAKLAKGLGLVIRPEDLGAGPWRLFLTGQAKSKDLVWFEPVAEKDDEREEAARKLKYALVAAAEPGRGLVVVAALEQLAGPDSDAVGRAAMNELILWLLARGQVDQWEK